MFDESSTAEACRPITHRSQECRLHMFSFCELPTICVLDGFILLTIPRPENAELLILCDAIVLEGCYVALCDVLISLMCYRNLHVNHCDPKSDLNSCFRIRLLVCDLEM